MSAKAKRSLPSLSNLLEGLPILGAVFVGGYLAIQTNSADVPAYTELWAMAVVTVIGLMLTIAVQRRKRARAITYEWDIIQEIEGRGDDRAYHEFLEDQIELNVRRDRISMLRAEQRADNLFNIGRALMVISVVAPLATAATYVLLPPLPESAVLNIVRLKTELGALPEGVQIAVNRDWKLLFAGVSVGFLFLAAARGVMTQQSKESETFFLLTEKLAESERLVSVLKIRMRGSPDGRVPSELADDIVRKLLEPRQALRVRQSQLEGAEKDSQIMPVDEMLARVKQLSS